MLKMKKQTKMIGLVAKKSQEIILYDDNGGGGTDLKPPLSTSLKTEELTEILGKSSIVGQFSNQEYETYQSISCNEDPYSEPKSPLHIPLHFEAETAHLPTANKRMQAIRQTLLNFTIQLFLCTTSASIMVSFPQTSSFKLQIASLLLLVVSWRTGINSQSRMAWFGSMITFFCFSMSLSISLTILAEFFSYRDVSHGLLQLSAVVVGLCVYGHVCNFETWSSQKELAFMILPNLFVSIVFSELSVERALALLITGSISAFIGSLISNCAKDSFIPADGISQIVSDVFGVYDSAMSEAYSLFQKKINRIWQHEELF